jgi:hypothetical protein
VHRTVTFLMASLTAPVVSIGARECLSKFLLRDRVIETSMTKGPKIARYFMSYPNRWGRKYTQFWSSRAWDIKRDLGQHTTRHPGSRW